MLTVPRNPGTINIATGEVMKLKRCGVDVRVQNYVEEGLLNLDKNRLKFFLHQVMNYITQSNVNCNYNCNYNC